MHTGDDIGGINTNFLEVNDELPNSANNRGALNESFIVCFNICPSGEGEVTQTTNILNVEALLPS